MRCTGLCLPHCCHNYMPRRSFFLHLCHWGEIEVPSADLTEAAQRLAVCHESSSKWLKPRLRLLNAGGNHGPPSQRGKHVSLLIRTHRLREVLDPKKAALPGQSLQLIAQGIPVQQREGDEACHLPRDTESHSSLCKRGMPWPSTRAFLWGFPRMNAVSDECRLSDSVMRRIPVLLTRTYHTPIVSYAVQATSATPTT